MRWVGVRRDQRPSSKAARAEAYGMDAAASPFGSDGQLKAAPQAPEVEDAAAVELLAQLRSRLPGYLVPKLVREVPGAESKTPI